MVLVYGFPVVNKRIHWVRPSQFYYLGACMCSKFRFSFKMCLEQAGAQPQTLFLALKCSSMFGPPEGLVQRPPSYCASGSCITVNHSECGDSCISAIFIFSRQKIAFLWRRSGQAWQMSASQRFHNKSTATLLPLLKEDRRF